MMLAAIKRVSAVTAIVTGVFAIGGCAEEQKPKAVVVDHQSPNLPTFRFRGMIVGRTSIEEAERAGTISDCKPVDKTDGKISHCKFVKQELAGLPVNDLGSFVAFENGRFASFVMTFEPKMFASVSVAALDAYGAMCNHPSREHNVRSVWCYNSGLLLVEEPGLFLDNSTSFRFSPYKTTEGERPKYSPDTL